jgi:hypothetical protein
LFYLLFDYGVKSSIDLTVAAGFDFGRGWSWTPPSADLNPCDYFYQGLLKAKVYKYNHHPHLVEELKAEFTVAVEMSLKKQRQQLWFVAREQSTEYSRHKSFKSHRELQGFVDINKWYWMCRDHILKIHVLWDVTLDQWMNSSTAVPSPAGKTLLKLSDPEDEGTITFQNAQNYSPNDSVTSPEDLNLWHHHS